MGMGRSYPEARQGDNAFSRNRSQVVSSEGEFGNVDAEERPKRDGNARRKEQWKEQRKEQWREGIVQSVAPSGLCDLGPGYPDDRLVPAADISRAVAEAIRRYGVTALAYGHNQGPLPFREALAARLSRRDGDDVRPEQLLVTAGTSQTLDVLAGALASPKDVVLVESLSYDLGLRIFRDRGLAVREVAMDASGVRPDALERAVREERAAHRNVAFAYLVPTFHNPTGTLMPRARRRDVLDVAHRNGLLLLEDDAYGELALGDEEPPPALSTLAGHRGSWRLGTFSKSLAPGLRLGWLAADAESVARLAARGLFDSGGCPSQLAALGVAELLRDGGYGHHLDRLRGALGARRDALAVTLRALLPGTYDVTVPGGGLFTWIGLPPGRGEQDSAAAARRAGVLVARGSRFGTPTRPALRLAHGAHSPDRLRAAARALAAAWGHPHTPLTTPAPPTQGSRPAWT